MHEVLDLGEQARIDSDGAFDVRRRDDAGVLRLDPSGVVKGWAVHRASAHLEQLSNTDYCLGAGGDIVAHVHSPGAASWRVGIEDPRDPARLVAWVPLRRGAVATSSATHRGAHITDARTGAPPRGLRSVTVICASLTRADIDATTAFALGPDGAKWLSCRPGAGGLVVKDDGSVITLGTATGPT